jgi:hypothetical protein
MAIMLPLQGIVLNKRVKDMPMVPHFTCHQIDTSPLRGGGCNTERPASEHHGVQYMYQKYVTDI